MAVAAGAGRPHLGSGLWSGTIRIAPHGGMICIMAASRLRWPVSRLWLGVVFDPRKASNRDPG
jgi:hypothetical protein